MKNSVLIVEPDQYMREIIKSCLEAESYDCLEAETVLEAMDILRTRKVSVILCDVALRRTISHECTKYYMEVAPNVPVIAITNHADQPFATSFIMRKKMKDQLLKPFDKETLGDILEKWIPKVGTA